jgi:serine/threonine protein kinase
MTSSDTTLPQIDPASATVAWDQLSERVDALIAGWESPNRPPAIGSFLPAEPAELRRLILTELIKVDLEYRWQQHHLPKTIEEYLAEFPELSVGGSISPDLIYEEYHVRRQTSAPPDPREYLRRFPQQAEQLRRMLDLQGGATTTAAVGSKRRPVDIGERIDDFDVLLTLGKGAFASVYLARQRSMQRIVALKVSRDQGVESQTLAQLDHPYIVRVYDQRVLETEKLRLMYMQHIPGGTLQDVLHHCHNVPSMLWNGKHFLAAIDEQLEKHGESAPTESSVRRRLGAASWPEVVCWFGARLASALDYAHGRGVLHRDVKPANVLLASDGSPKLADFNVSFSSKVDGATPAAYFGGSLAYMSPEQLEASDPDHSRQPGDLDGRSDVYSLGVMLWEMLFGTRPFGEERMASSMSETLKELAARRRAGVPRSTIEALPRGLPAGLVKTLLACLEPNPADRPATAGAVGRQLELCLQPRTQQVFRPSPKSFRQLARTYPVRLFTFAGVLPNLVFSLFNLAFNFGTIVQQLTDDQKSMFWTQVLYVNPIAYTIGILFGVRLVWPVIKAVRDVRHGRQLPPESLPALRARSLLVGDYIALVGFALWFFSGLAFPIGLALVGPFDSAITKYYIYFFLSQIVFGLISSTQAFFLITYISLAGFHPLLVKMDQPDPEDGERLMRLDRRLNWYFAMAFAAPLIAVVIVSLMQFDKKVDDQGKTAVRTVAEELKATAEPTRPSASAARQPAKADQHKKPLIAAETLAKWATAALALIGGISFIFVFKLWRAIQGDIAAIMTAIDPERAAAQVSGDSMDSSFWTSSR